MKRTVPFLLLLAMLSVVSGYLMSKARWIARVDMTFFHKDLNFLKIWWQGAAGVYIVLLLLFLVHSFLQKKLLPVAARLSHLLLLLAAMTGFYFTYNDFANNLPHHLTGRRFHMGCYLFWAGWALICLFFLFKSTTSKQLATDPGKREPANS